MLLAELEVPLAMMERSGEFAFGNDRQYQALAVLSQDIAEALERFNEILTDNERVSSVSAAEWQSVDVTQPESLACLDRGTQFVRADLLKRFQSSCVLEHVLVTAEEFLNYYKTTAGRWYIASFQWVMRNQQS